MKLLNVLGTTASVVGIAASILSGWVNEKKLDIKIAEKVTDALQKRG